MRVLNPNSRGHTKAWQQNQKWPMFGQIGYITPAFSGVPTRGNKMARLGPVEKCP